MGQAQPLNPHFWPWRGFSSKLAGTKALNLKSLCSLEWREVVGMRGEGLGSKGLTEETRKGYPRRGEPGRIIPFSTQVLGSHRRYRTGERTEVGQQSE